MPDLTVAQWEARVASARADLADAALLVEVTHQGRDVGGSAKPAMAILSGGERIRAGAHIGVLSGSFNPLTNAHVELGSAALGSGGIDVLVWCCAAASIDKEGVMRATLADRLVQMRAYAQHETAAAVALMNRGLYVDQASLVGGLGAPGAVVSLIVGFDKAVQIFDARYYVDRDAALTKMFAEARLLVAPRDDTSEDDLRLLLAQPENAHFAGRVAFLDVRVSVRTESSTEARRLADREADAVTIERLHALLPPEGFALADTEGPYRQRLEEAADSYLWRSRWVTELARFSMAIPQPWPSIRDLVAATVTSGPVGAEIRRLVMASRSSAEPDSFARALKRASIAN